MDVKTVNLSYICDERTAHKLLPPGADEAGVNIYRCCGSGDAKAHLKKVSMDVEASSLSCIMGTAVGLEPVILLRSMALRLPGGHFHGTILHDGGDRAHGIYRDIALVDGGAYSRVHHFSLSRVFDVLCFATRLRTNYDGQSSREHSRDILRLVDLEPSLLVANLSVVEKRLLAIAMEISSAPRLLCIEDPMRGLDTLSSLRMMRTLLGMTRQQVYPVTIIMALDAPNCEVLQHVDYMTLICDGDALFSGPPLINVVYFSF